jgi:hypothetical protein
LDEDKIMIDFTTVSREFRSVVSRRRGLLTFLGSVFAALGIFLQNALQQGSLPPALEGILSHIFAFYAVMLMVPCLILALRIAKLHGGMVLNGMLYARLMQEQTFTKPGQPDRAARHNFLGVSFLIFLLVAAIAGFSATVLALAFKAHLAWAVPFSGVVIVVLLLLYFRFHRQAVGFARLKIDNEPCAPFSRDEWEAHVSGSLEDTNEDMLTIIAFVGLIVFSVFEILSGLGNLGPQDTDLAPKDVQKHGPWVYCLFMATTCLMGLITYVRLRVAVGSFSLQIDPNDRPFRPLRLTDSLLGYLLLAFLLAVSVHLLVVTLFPVTEDHLPGLLLLDAAVFGLAVLAEQITLVLARRRYQP